MNIEEFFNLPDKERKSYLTSIGMRTLKDFPQVIHDPGDFLKEFKLSETNNVRCIDFYAHRRSADFRGDFELMYYGDKINIMARFNKSRTLVNIVGTKFPPIFKKEDVVYNYFQRGEFKTLKEALSGYFNFKNKIYPVCKKVWDFYDSEEFIEALNKFLPYKIIDRSNTEDAPCYSSLVNAVYNLRETYPGSTFEFLDVLRLYRYAIKVDFSYHKTFFSKINPQISMPELDVRKVIDSIKLNDKPLWSEYLKELKEKLKGDIESYLRDQEKKYDLPEHYLKVIITSEKYIPDNFKDKYC